jgi:hypothetical protein
MKTKNNGLLILSLKLKNKTMENKKQSSIEWLEQEFVKLEATVGVYSVMYELIDKAKAMHKEEIIKANRDGVDMVIDKKPYVTGEDYYNETFGGNNEN